MLRHWTSFMHHYSCRHLPFGLIATALAGVFGCNSHGLVSLRNPDIVYFSVDAQPLPTPVEPGLRDAGQAAPPATDGPRPDGAIPDTAVVVRGPDAAASPDVGLAAGPEAGRDSARDSSPDIGPDTGPCLNSLPPRNFPANPTCQGTEGGLGEAFQKALWFLNVNKSGPGVINTYVQWRGDAHVMDQHIKLDPTAATGVNMSQAFITQNRAILDPNGTGEVDLSGGFHDAGDFIKFGLTTGFTASTLAWSMYEFPNSFRDAGLEDEAVNLLRWVDDYFVRSTFLDAGGNLVAFAHQVGDQTDHTCGWMPPELRRIDFCPRKG